MVTKEQIQGYARTLYEESPLRQCILTLIVLFVTEKRYKLNPKHKNSTTRKSFYIPDLVHSLETHLYAFLSDFFGKDEIWIDASEFILSYLEVWYSNPKYGVAVLKEFSPVLVSPLGYMEARQIESLQHAENFLTGVATVKIASKVIEAVNLSTASYEELEDILGISKSEKDIDQNRYFREEDGLKQPSFTKRDKIVGLSVSDILSASTKRKKKKKTYQRKNLLNHIPQDIKKVSIECSECRHNFKPKWLKTTEHPYIPITPNDGQGLWIPCNSYLECPCCGEFTTFTFPMQKQLSKILLFGDEAYREGIEGVKKSVYTYSLVGADFKVLSKIENSIRLLKSELCPHETPDNWVFHMKEIWPSSNRRKHHIFRNWDFEKVREAIQGIFQVIQDNAEYLFMFNIAWTTNNSSKSKSSLKQLKHSAYISLVTYVINELTKVQAQPHFKFDAERKTETDTVIQSWARDAFSGSQHCLLYPFLSRGINIPEPIFVQPASHPCLEIADFISYIIARLHLKRWQGKEIEELLNPSHLGKVLYLGTDKTGDLVFHRTEEYPWDLYL